jgi:hypothetical protein
MINSRRRKSDFPHLIVGEFYARCGMFGPTARVWGVKEVKKMTTRNSKVLHTIPLLVAACLVGLITQAKDITSAPSGTNTYVFMRDQSTVVQTGGIAGIQETYYIEGDFQLSVNSILQTARFVRVHGTATEDSPPGQSVDLDDVLNLTGLVGVVQPDDSIRFEGKAADTSDFVLTLTFENDLVYLKGQTTPPAGGADFFIYTLDAVARRKYGGGTGESGLPYLIYTAEQMNAVGQRPGDWDMHFRLMADIDLSDFLYYCALIAPDTDSDEERFQGTAFSGVFDGNSHKISHFTVIGADYLGLFGRLESTAEIRDVQLEHISIVGSGGCIGALAGYNYFGDVTGCSSDGNIIGDWQVGGLVGISHGNLTDCQSSGSVCANGFHVGGLVGFNGGAVTACYSDVFVSGGIYAGGLVGLNFGTVSKSFSAGQVVCVINVAGGLVGYNIGDMTQCYSTSALDGVFFVGGLAGVNSGNAICCYSLSTVSGYCYVGGLIGYNEHGYVDDCYSAGVVTAYQYVGGLIGIDSGASSTVIASFWDIQTSGHDTSAGGTGKTTAEMKIKSTYEDAGWDLEQVWYIPDNDYPHLLWEIADQ